MFKNQSRSARYNGSKHLLAVVVVGVVVVIVVRGRGRGGRARILVLPSHRQPKSIGGGETSPPDLGAHLWVHTEGPHDGGFEGWGSVGRGLRGGE